jgi:hypothetical protein
MKLDNALLPELTMITETLVTTINTFAVLTFGNDDKTEMPGLFIRNILTNLIGNYILNFTNLNVENAFLRNTAIFHAEIDEWIETAVKQGLTEKKEKLQ